MESIISPKTIETLEQIKKQLDLMCECEKELNRLGIDIVLIEFKARDSFLKTN